MKSKCLEAPWSTRAIDSFGHNSETKGPEVPWVVANHGNLCDGARQREPPWVGGARGAADPYNRTQKGFVAKDSTKTFSKDSEGFEKSMCFNGFLKAQKELFSNDSRRT